MTLEEKLLEKYEIQYGAKPEFLVRSPGRVNLIGDHTDYNDGLVMPIAIDRACWIAGSAREDSQVVLSSLDFQEKLNFSLDQYEKTNQPAWGEYVKSVAWVLQEAGHALQGWQGVSIGDIPRGAGLSSSASLELGIARVFAHVSALDWNAIEMAQLSQKAENEWVGVNSGIMDQLTVACGQKDRALFLDCRTLEVETVSLPSGSKVVILDTRTRRGLVDSAYNQRRQQCEMACEYFQIASLRDLTIETLEKHLGKLAKDVYHRALHVVTENQRVERAVTAMKTNDVEKLGMLMQASHESLRDDYEVSNDELNEIVECALTHASCVGARMTGAGFGGCAIALIQEGEEESFINSVSQCYEQKSGITPRLYVCNIADGVEVLSLPY